VIAELLDAQVLVETPQEATVGRGRPSTQIALNPVTGVVVGLDFGFRHVRGIIADATHEIIARSEHDLHIDYSPAQGIGAAVDLVEQLVQMAGVPRSRLARVGAAIPAPVDTVTGTISVAGMMPSWDGVDVRDALTDAIGIPVVVDNDTKLAAYGEFRWGAAKGQVNVLYLKLHSGVGGAVIINESLVHGHSGAAGHFGHISVRHDGQLCRCGGRGCLETYVGIPAIVNALAPVHGDISFQKALQLLRSGDAATQRVFGDAAHMIGQVAGMLSNALNPDLVVLGGALSVVSSDLMPEIRAGLIAASLPVNHETKIAVGELGADASAMGALGAALDSWLVAR